MLIKKVDQSLERLKLAASVDNAQKLCDDLSALHKKLQSCESAIKLYMKNVTETKSAINASVYEQYKLVESLRRFCSDALDGKKDRALQDFQNVESELESGNKELKKCWSDYKRGQYSSSVVLINALLNIFEDDDQILDELGALRSSIDSKQIGNRQTVTEIQKFRSLTEEFITSKKMKPEIQDFVMKLAAGDDILLSEISEEIFSWIRINRLDKKVSLSMQQH